MASIIDACIDFFRPSPRSRQPCHQEEEHQSNILRSWGGGFENFVIGMFSPSRFRLLPYTLADAITRDSPVPLDDSPSLCFREVSTGQVFWVVCTYTAELAEDMGLGPDATHRLEGYRGFSRRTGEPVFVITGIGGTPDDPERIHIQDAEQMHWSPLRFGKYRGPFGKVESLDELTMLARGIRL